MTDHIHPGAGDRLIFWVGEEQTKTVPRRCHLHKAFTITQNTNPSPRGRTRYLSPDNTGRWDLGPGFSGLPQECQCTKSILETNEFAQLRASVDMYVKCLLTPAICSSTAESVPLFWCQDKAGQLCVLLAER